MRFVRHEAVRWLATPILALLAVTVAQALMYEVGLMALYVAVRPTALDATVWAAKAFSSVFMGAVFVGTARWVAPRHKQRVALAAFALVMLWSSRLITAAFTGEFFPWLAAMGVAGGLGGASMLWWSARATSVDSAVPTH